MNRGDTLDRAGIESGIDNQNHGTLKMHGQPGAVLNRIAFLAMSTVCKNTFRQMARQETIRAVRAEMDIRDVCIADDYEPQMPGISEAGMQCLMEAAHEVISRNTAPIAI